VSTVTPPSCVGAARQGGLCANACHVIKQNVQLAVLAIHRRGQDSARRVAQLAAQHAGLCLPPAIVANLEAREAWEFFTG
jgi:hypothetical protein